MDFSETIKQLRAKKNITQRDLAKKLGISYVQLNRYEKGSIRPRIEMVAKIAEALETDYNSLYSLLNTNNSRSENVIDLPRKESMIRIKKVLDYYYELSLQEKIIFGFTINNDILLNVKQN